MSAPRTLPKHYRTIDGVKLTCHKHGRIIQGYLDAGLAAAFPHGILFETVNAGILEWYGERTTRIDPEDIADVFRGNGWIEHTIRGSYGFMPPGSPPPVAR